MIVVDIYLNAKVSQLLLKCYFLLFEPKILLHDIMINKSNDLPSKQHENQTSETYDCRSSTSNVRQPKFEKSQSLWLWYFLIILTYYLQHLTIYWVTVLHHLTFYSEKMFNRYLFSKSEGQTNPSRLFYAFGNVHYVNVKPSIFDVIGRLRTTEYQ